MWIWIFQPKINEFVRFFNQFEFSRKILSKFDNFQFLFILFCTALRFWRENSNHQSIFGFKNSQKSLIFRSKIQIHNSENWISGHNLWFSDSVVRRPTIKQSFRTSNNLVHCEDLRRIYYPILAKTLREGQCSLDPTNCTTTFFFHSEIEN